jgi:hypothetical protein
MESEIVVRGDTAERIKTLWKTVETHRDEAVSAAGFAAKCAIECGQIIAELRDDFGNAGWEKWMTANVPEIPIPKATRLASVGVKYRNFDPGQLEFRTVKELYQATDILPPAAPSNPKSKVIDTNWTKAAAKLEGIIPHLNDGQREMLRQWMVKMVQRMDRREE